MSVPKRFLTGLCLIGACAGSWAQLQLVFQEAATPITGFDSKESGQTAAATYTFSPSLLGGTISSSFGGSFLAAAGLDTNGSGFIDYKTESITSTVEWSEVFNVVGPTTQTFTLQVSDERRLTLFSDGANSYSSASLSNWIGVWRNGHLIHYYFGPYATASCQTNFLYGPGPCHGPTGSFDRQTHSDYISMTVAVGDTITLEGYAAARVSSGAKAFSTAGGGASASTTWVASVTPVTPIPEPSTYAMMIVGLSAVLVGVRRRAKSRA